MVKATGVSRHVDELGRVVIPKELRRTLGIAKKDPLDIFVHEDQIILRKHTVGCIFCGELTENTKYFQGKEVCFNCLVEVTRLQSEMQAAATTTRGES